MMPGAKQGINALQLNATTWHDRSPTSQTKLLIFLWTTDFESRADSSFVLDLAAALRQMKHDVLLESPKDGEVLQNLDSKCDFGARVNPHLEGLLEGRGSLSEALHGETPHFIILFSSAWSSVFSNLSPPASRLIWYFYQPETCPGKPGNDKVVGFLGVF